MNVGKGSISSRCWKERASSPTLHQENIDDDDDDDNDEDDDNDDDDKILQVVGTSAY